MSIRQHIYRKAEVSSTRASTNQKFQMRQFATKLQPKQASLRGQLSLQSQGNLLGRTRVSPRATIQPKITIGAPNDKYEQEADRIADAVMNMSAPSSDAGSNQPLAAAVTPIAATDSGSAQTAPEGTASAASSAQESQLNLDGSGGSALPQDVRSFMEQRFGADFSHVRVHTDSNAVQMNKQLNSHAFTYGSNIYYGSGKSPGKDHLTAHELTHVIQQTGAG
ncbi:eCIS core domain-containing protein [Aerosakkonema funiforme]|uniref:DUF4157 domain-containing protein n=1 Tax=Aerosakkonema funiforme FACHB-1375 TaxID=2949571 RepID=A0A926ZM89_9CYAN|nr:DUF4157 domain-containing protein [Aerosakkonema funiforme]MBD2185841.1 DUF4157 domain-containing protein [Aerosakkonema funiforme FACHB-1375]